MSWFHYSNYSSHSVYFWNINLHDFNILGSLLFSTKHSPKPAPRKKTLSLAGIYGIMQNAWHIWTASSEFGTYRLCEQRRFRRACASAQSRQNLCCSLIQAVSQEEPSDGKPDPWPLWMAGHAQLKFVMTECSKTQIRLTRLIWCIYLHEIIAYAWNHLNLQIACMVKKYILWSWKLEFENTSCLHLSMGYKALNFVFMWIHIHSTFLWNQCHVCTCNEFFYLMLLVQFSFHFKVAIQFCAQMFWCLMLEILVNQKSYLALFNACDYYSSELW